MNLYGKYLSIHLKSLMQYKVSFFLTAFGQFLISFSAILGVYFLLDRFHAIKGYTFTDILLCSSVIIMAFSLAECFARGFDQFPKRSPMVNSIVCSCAREAPSFKFLLQSWSYRALAACCKPF